MSVLDKYRPTTGSSKGWKPTPPKAVVPKKKGIIESAFDKENYVEKFKRGDIKGGIANFVGSPLRALQSGYLNLLDAPHALYHGERPTFKYNMDYEDFEKEVARRGGVTPVSERIKNPALRSIYKMGMEIGTDPIELTPLGFYKDIQRARAGSQATGAYAESLQAGKLVPRVNGAKQANANTPNRPVQPRNTETGATIPIKEQTPVKRDVFPKANVPHAKKVGGGTLSNFRNRRIAGYPKELESITKDEFLARKAKGEFKGYDYKPTTSTYTADATFDDGIVSLSDKFFGHSADTRNHLLRHENAHATTLTNTLYGDNDTSQALWKAIQSKDNAWKYDKNLNEAVTDMFAVYAKNPTALKENLTRQGLPEVYTAIERLYKGVPLSKSKYPELAKYMPKVPKYPNTPDGNALQMLDDLIKADPTTAKAKGWAEQAETLRAKVFGGANEPAKVVPKPLKKSVGADIARPYNITKKPSATIKPLDPESKFVFDMPKKKTSFKETGQKFRSSFVDSSAAIRDAEIDIRGVKKARLGAKVLPDAEKSLYKTIALSKGSPEKAIYRIKENLVPTVRAYEKSGGKARHLSMYAEAVHAKDINKAGLKSGLSNAEIDTLIKKYGTPKAEKARQALVKYNDDLLKDLAGSGVIGQNEYKAMREKWPNYMPINRVMDDDKVELADGIRKALFEGHKPIKSLRGSERKIIDPIVSMAKNTYKYETAIGKGAINKQIVAFAKDDTAGKYIRRLEKGADTYRKNVVSILEDGKKVQFEASPEVYRALKDLDKESSSMLINILSQPASVLRAGAVLTPDFATKNFIRDNFQAFINSESGYVPMVDFVRGLASYFKKDQYYVDFIKSRGAFGIITDMDKDAYMVAQNLVVNQPMGKKFVNVLNPKKWLDVLRDVTEVSEYGTRLGEYKAALRKGASKAEAAYRARDLQDFMRAGSQTKIANRVVPFLNADIQGKSRILRALKERPVEAGTKLLAMMAGPSIAAQAMNHVLANEDQKAMLKDTPQWQKDIFWLVAIPGTNTIARIPKPFEGAPISMVIERFFDKVANEDEQAFDGILEDMARDQMIPVMPTAFGPIVESLANYSFFMDMPVVPQRMENLERQDQHDYRTSEPAKALAKVLSYVLGEDSRLASPMAAQHMIKGYTAGLGEYVTDGIDLLTGNRKKPYPNIPQMPVVKSFTINPHSGGKSSDFIYSELNKLTKAKNSRPDEFKEEPQRKFLSYTQKELSALAKEIREVQNSDKLTGKQKRDKLNILYPKRNKLAQKAQEDYKKINEITERLSKTIKDEDELIREVNRTMYGAKEALKRYDKSVYERAVKSRVPYDKFYEAYFATRNIESDKINGKSISAGSKEEMQGLGESASLKTRRAIDSIKGLSDEDRRKLYDIFNVAKSIKNRTIILPIKR